MSQLRLAPFAPCCTAHSREVCTNKMGFLHLTWQSEEAQPNVEMCSKALTEYFLRQRCPGEPQRTGVGVQPRRPSLRSGHPLWCACSHRSHELHIRIVHGKHCACAPLRACCFCQPLPGSPAQTNHRFTTILHVLTRVCVCLRLC